MLDSGWLLSVHSRQPPEGTHGIGCSNCRQSRFDCGEKTESRSAGWELIFALLLALVAFVVLYPILLLIINSFQVGIFGRETTWGLDNWRTALSEPKFREAIFNTLTLTAVRQLFAFTFGVCLAWLFARTNLPGKNILEFGFWVAFFLPALTVTLGWILIFDGERGLANKLLMNLPFVQGPVFDIFSWWGIVFAHLVTGTLASKVILLTPAFRNLDSSLRRGVHCVRREHVEHALSHRRSGHGTGVDDRDAARNHPFARVIRN